MSGALRRIHQLPAAALAGGVVLMSLFVVAPTAHGATFAVTSTADSGPGSLRQAIFDANAAPGADTVEVPAGTYNLLELIGITDDLTISGAGADQTIISGNFATMLFIVSPGTDVTFDGVTLQQGRAPANNNGGAIQAIGVGSLTIRDSAINNSAAWRGGGVVTSGGPVTIERSSFSGNSSERGGAFLASNSLVTITDSTFDANETRHLAEPPNGGAIYVLGGTLDVRRSTFSSNTAGELTDPGLGGAIHVDGSTPAIATIVNSTFSSNFAFDAGGAVAATSGAAVNVVHSTFRFNVGYFFGGGGLYASGGLIQLTGTLLQENVSTTADSNCAVGDGTIASSGGNLSDDTTCTGLTEPSDLNNNGGTTLGALADNGGLTHTHALLAGSSAVDAAPCVQGLTEDQRTVVRPQGSDCDIGAYELDAAAVTTTTVAVTTTTVADTTTTVADTTTTVADTTTTVAGTTTTVAGTTTTVAGTTTTVADTASTTTLAGTTTTVDLSAEVLPDTGSTNWLLLTFAALLLAGGSVIVLVARRA